MAALLSPLSEDPWAAPASSSLPSTAATGAPSSSTSAGYVFSGSMNGASAPSTTSASLLDEDVLPSIYAQAWDAAVASSSAVAGGGSTFTLSNGGYISFTALHKVLSVAAGLSASETERIMALVTNKPGASNTPGSPAGSMTDSYTGAIVDSPLRPSTAASTRTNRSGFYLALALTALSQQRLPVSLQALANRRSNPPVPKLNLGTLSQAQSTMVKPGATGQSGFSTSPVHNRAYKLSLGSSGDPWSSSPTAGPSSASTLTNGYKASQMPFSVPEESGQPSGFKASYASPSRNGLTSSSSYNGGYSSFPAFPEDENEDGFGGAGSGSRGGDLQGLAQFNGAAEFARSLTRVEVLQQAEIAGSFWDRHTVYLVVSTNARSHGHSRSTSSASAHGAGGGVVRRYSDWVWLNEVLERKYPARMRPTLPPKRVGISARHLPIAADELFLERRRKSLARYLEFVANHHIVKHERCVQVFLNESVDLATWRKTDLASALPASAVGQDETASGPTLSPTQLSSIPVSFDTTLTNLREMLPLVLESMARFIGLLERIAARDLANSADLLRAKMALDSFGEALGPISGTSASGLTNGSAAKAGSGGRPRESDEDTLILARDMVRFSSSLGTLAEQSEAQSARFSAVQVERLKGLREVWRSLLALLKAYDGPLRVDAADKLKKRIEASQGKYQSLASTPQANRKPNHHEELEKLLKSIEEDQDGVQKALERRERVRYQVAQEVRVAWRWSTLLRVELAEWASVDAEHAQGIAQIWSALQAAIAISE